jgi:hypothetical protein
VFNHPLEASFACTGLGGWPKLYFEIGFIDSYDHSDLCTFCCLPIIVCFISDSPMLVQAVTVFVTFRRHPVITKSTSLYIARVDRGQSLSHVRFFGRHNFFSD